MNWKVFTKSNQAKPGVRMRCPTTGNEYVVSRRGRVEGRVGILIEFKDSAYDIAVVDAKNRWQIESTDSGLQVMVITLLKGNKLGEKN